MIEFILIAFVGVLAASAIIAFLSTSATILFTSIDTDND